MPSAVLFHFGNRVRFILAKDVSLITMMEIFVQFKNLPERWSLPIGKRLFQIASLCLLSLALVTWASAETTSKVTSSHAKASSIHTSSRHHSSKHTSHVAKRSRGQHSIGQERTREIQTALIREHYLTGEPTGVWDDTSRQAMVRYQAANGWQTRITPDSRALIKLGLGPDHKGLLNPETANIPSPHELGVDTQTQPGGAADQE